MSRQVDRSEPLSDEDRQYLLNHGQDGLVAQFDARFPDASPEEAATPDVEPGFTGDGTRDPGAEDGPDEDPGYEEWSAEDLRAEIDERNEQTGREAKISKAGSRADMAARLRADDSQG